ncbi:ABC transporter substrate-binding protein, partial [Candidatus Latescibacterota bacterium]
VIIHFRQLAMYIFSAIVMLLQVCILSREVYSQPEPVTLRVVVVPFLSFAPLFIAEEEGYFSEQGIQVEFVKMERSSIAVPPLVQGKLDVIAGGISASFLNAMARGANIKFVAGKGYFASSGCNYAAFLARRALVEGGKLNSPSQLRGLRIAAMRATFTDYLLEKLLETADLTLDHVKFINIPYTTDLEAFKNGTIDISYSAEPWLTRILQTGEAVLWETTRKVAPDFQNGFILFGPTLLKENPDAGRRFMIAYLKAVQQYNQGKTERNLEILSKHTGLDQELLKKACWLPIHEDGRINAESVLDFQAWAVEKGYLDNTITENQFWDPSFIEYANEVLKIPIR